MRFNTIVFIVCLIVLSCKPHNSRAQEKKLNKFGLYIISKPSDFKKSIKGSPGKEMVDVRVIPHITVELLYTTKQNFMKRALYPNTTTTYLRKQAVDALMNVQNELFEKGLGIKIWDAYRPYSVTEQMWEPIKDERYVANPVSGSGHNRGVSVDLTLQSFTTKKELNMGTGFDHFSDTAHISFKDLPQDVLNNRILLKNVMEKNGFIVLESEWWHFYLPEAKNFELLNISFKALAKLNKKHREKQ